MIIKKKGALSKALAVAGVAALSTVGLSLTAQATEGPSFGNINATAKGSITIYKHENQTAAPITTGTVADANDALEGKSNPVADVVFKYFPFSGLALTGDGANANWKKISKVTPEKLENACNGVSEDNGTPVLEGFTFGTGVAMDKTNAKGMAKVAELSVGAYLLCEVKAPEKVVGKASPFIVTIPHPDTVTKKWHYDVTVYPKNTVGGIDKTIEAQRAHGFEQGKEIHWPVTVTIPNLATDEHLAYLIVEDPLTDARYDMRDVVSVSVTDSSGGNSVTLTTDDYKLTNNSNKLAVGLTKAGLAKVEAKQGGKLKVVYKTTLKSIGNGIFKNKANLRMRTWHHDIPENPPTDPNTPPTAPPGTPTIPPFPENPPESPEVRSNWGQVKIKKVDAGDSSTPLAGAKFQIYSATDETAYNDDCSTAVKDSSPLEIGSAKQTTLTTNASGEIDFGGFFVSDSVHDPINKEFRCYIIVETQAPDGYVLPTSVETPIKVKIGEVAASSYSTTIENTKTTVPGLPLTGANGRILMLILGGGLIAITAGGWVAYRRRQQSQD